MTLSLRSTLQILRQAVLKSIGSLAGQEFCSAMDRCLIIAPHPDDEVLGCGGLLARHAAAGKRIEVLFLTNGEASHKGCCTAQENQIGIKRCHLAISANKILGVPPERLHFLEERDGKLPHTGEDGFIRLAEKIAAWIEKSEPTAVFCPHPFEGWSDHIATAEITRAAITILPKRPKLYHYCVWFWYSMPLKRAWRIDWRKARILDISTQRPIKQQAMHVYLDALAPCGHPWVGKLPSQFLRAFDWNKELFFEADISNLMESNQ
jgi:LmbE family N-acetylglucosaminyl deacetylase